MVNGPSSLMIDLRDTVMLDGYAKNYQRVDFSAGPSAEGRLVSVFDADLCFTPEASHVWVHICAQQESWTHSGHSPAGKSIV